MTILFLDGFDHYTADSQLADKWGGGGQDWTTVGSGASRWGGGYGLDLYGENGYQYLNLHTLHGDKRWPALYFGMAMKKYTSGIPSPSSTVGQCHFFNDSTTQVRFVFWSDYSIRCYNGNGSLLGQTLANVWPNSGWFYVEYYVKVHNTAGEVIVRVNEQTVLNLSGIDTYNTGDVDLARLYIRGIRSYKTTYYDDIWVDDAQFHGNCRIRTFYPDSDGTYSQWIRNTGSNDFEMVDERPPDGDTTYIYSVTKGHKSSFGITTGAFNEPAKGMQMIHRLRTPDTGARRVKLFVRSGAADHFAPVSKVISPSNVWYGHNQLRNGLWLNDPADDNPWTQAKLEAAEFGVQLVGPTTTTSTTSTTTTS